MLVKCWKCDVGDGDVKLSVWWSSSNWQSKELRYVYRIVGLAEQSKKCAVSCGPWWHDGQRFKLPKTILSL